MTDGPAGTLLFVDDDVGNRQTLCLVFRGQGYSVLEAGTGHEALELACRHRPDLVVLDINLPDISGYEVCRRLRDDPCTRSASVLQLSAVYVGPGDRSAGLEGGADAYLTKPVEPRELLATARALLRVRAAEEAARRAAQQWRATFDAIRDVVCLLDADGHIRRCNRALCELVGLGFEQLLGRSLGEVLRQELGADTNGELCAQADWQDQELSLAGRHFRVSCDPIRDEADEPHEGRVIILTDVTQHRQLEERLRQSQRLEAVGRLAGGIAHDFNNLLTAVLGNAALLMRSLPPGESDHALAATIERAAWRTADLTRQLLGFSRQTLLWLQTVAPGRLLDEAAAAIGPKLPANVRLTLLRGDDLWPIQADPAQLIQVLTALCVNSVDAMPGGGRITIGAANRRESEDSAARHLDARPGEYLCLAVEDTGVGIAAELIDKIFDPFFTTKPMGQGRGLGLAMVHGIVKQHRGWVECRSEPGRGARFELSLPRAADAPAEAAPAALVLLADDNDTLRALAAAYLIQGGYGVLSAGDGAEAVELFRREGRRVGLVILSRQVAGSGRDVVAQLREMAPGVRVLLATGSLDEGGPVEGAVGVVGRPYRERELLDAVRQALA